MKRLSASLILIISLFTFVTNTNAQTESTDVWMGVLDVNTVKLNVRFEIKEDDKGKTTGAMYSPDQTEQAFPFDSLVYDDKKFEFEVKMLRAQYEGKFNADRTKIEGTFTQAGMKLPLALEKSDKPVSDIGPMTQRWVGDMKAGARTFKFQFRVFENAAGERTIKLDSLTEGIRGMNCEMEIDERKVTIKVPTPGAPAVYTGEIDDNHEVVSGEWAQGGGKFPLVLKSVGLDEEPPKRPQTPTAPFSYDVETVRFGNEKGKANLVGSLTLPKGDGPFPAVILINGSGAHDRDETIFGHKPFLVVADHLTKKGIAVLRYDERGVGESKGDIANATSLDLAGDAIAGIDFLQKHTKIEKTKIGIVGHSEGGLIATMIAAKRPDIAAIVMLAGPGVSGKRIIFNQSRFIAAQSGAPESMLDAQDVLLNRILEQMNDPAGYTDEFKTKLAEELGDSLPNSKTLVDVTIAKFDNPWMKYFVAYDPGDALLKTNCPMLAAFGAKDLQVDPALNGDALNKMIADSNKKNFEVVEFKNLNHLFQNCETGSPAEYATIEETFDEKALAFVSDWLNSKLK